MDNVSPRLVNRRLTARLACQLTVRYRTAKEWHPATAMDLSRNGCRVRLGEDLTRGSVVTVILEHPARDGSASKTAEVPGKIIWSRLEGLSYQAGIQFSAEPAALHEILGALAPA